jgi:uncharacterized membrane protein
MIIKNKSIRTSINTVVFLCGLISIIDVYMSIFEYGFSVSEISIHEIVFTYLVWKLLMRHYRVCRENDLGKYDLVCRPFIIVGWIYLVMFVITIVALVSGFIEFDELLSSEYMWDDWLQILTFIVMVLSIYFAIPKTLLIKVGEQEDNLGFEG